MLKRFCTHNKQHKIGGKYCINSFHWMVVLGLYSQPQKAIVNIEPPFTTYSGKVPQGRTALQSLLIWKVFTEVPEKNQRGS